MKKLYRTVFIIGKTIIKTNWQDASNLTVRQMQLTASECNLFSHSFKKYDWFMEWKDVE